MTKAERKRRHTRIRKHYAAMGTSLASFYGFFGQWSANSQYGYSLGWFSSQDAAESHALHYYETRMRLIDQ